MNLEKLAASDAAKWARAEMFFGEGAGTRRKLLAAEIDHKVETISHYKEEFANAYLMQDMAEHAIKAAKERQHIDRAVKISKNTRALVRGDRRGLSTGLAIIAGIAYVAHQTGYDKIALAKGKIYYRKVLLKIRSEIATRKLRHEFDEKGN